MTRIAFVTIGTTGHVFSALGTLDELAARGEEVVGVTTEPFRSPVEGVCHAFIPYHSSLGSNPTPRVDGFSMPQVPVSVQKEIEVAYPQVERILSDVRPDLVLYDSFTFAARLACESLELPAIRWSSMFVPTPLSNYFELNRSGLLPGVTSSEATLAEFNDRMAPVYRRYGLRPRDFLELVAESAANEIVSLPASLQPRRDLLHENVHFVGLAASRRSRPTSEIPTLVLESDHRPLIYISLGTVFNRRPEFFRLCVLALADLECRIIMSIGDGVPLDSLGALPPHVSVHRFVPQLDVVAAADLLISHAGAGAVAEACAYGVPAIFVPQYPEQLINANQAAAAGLGLCVEPGRLSVDELRSLAMRVLTGARYRRAGRQLARESEELGGARRAADIVQQLCVSTRRTHRV